jgi:hypothetical protein
MHFVLSGDQSQTYDRGIRLAMLSQLPRRRWSEWVERDAKWMLDAMTEKGNFADAWYGKRDPGYGDNANGQYGALGLWVYEQAGYPVPEKVWKAVDDYWRNAMLPADGGETGGWAIFSAAAQSEENFNAVTSNYRVSGPMTAGAVATLSVTERALYGPERFDPSKNNMSSHLRKGLEWLDRHFSLADTAEETDPYYYYWTIQRVGNATGRRTFNNIDWFREITARMLNEQQRDGTWSGPKGRLLSTGFAMLYLAEAFDPVAFGKVRFVGKDRTGKDEPDAWNSRPNDIWNLTDYLSDLYEYRLSWQIVRLDQPVVVLTETPVLYLATDSAFELSETEVDHLRQYIQAGGLLVTNPDIVSPDVARSINNLAKQLFGDDAKMQTVDRSHALYHLHEAVSPTVGMQMIDNGIRPLWIHFVRDIGKDLQTNDTARSPNFAALSNLFLHATGMNPRRIRLNNSYLTRRPNARTTRSLNVARLRHGGNDDPEPAALEQLGHVLANKHQLDLRVAAVGPAELSTDQKLAFLTTTGPTELSDQDAAAIRQWLVAGGTLLIDAAGGSAPAAEAAQKLAHQILPDGEMVPLSLDHPIITGPNPGKPGNINNRWLSYRPYALKLMGPVNVSRLQRINIGERAAIIYSSHDITCGLAGVDHWGIYGYSIDTARNLAANTCLWLSK